jgi:hypothetical protein
VSVWSVKGLESRRKRLVTGSANAWRRIAVSDGRASRFDDRAFGADGPGTGCKVPVGLAAMCGCSSSRSDDWPGRPPANSAENQGRGSGRLGRDGGTAASSRVVKMSSWLTVGEGVLAASISVVGLVFTFSSNRRAQYDRVLKLTAESGMPPIAEDRHVIGLVFEPQSKLPANRAVTLSEHEIAALFRVLWYFQRVDALYKSLQPPLWAGRITRSQALILDSLGPALGIWAKYIGYKLIDADGCSIETDGGDEGLCSLSSQFQSWQKRGGGSRSWTRWSTK